MSLLNAPEFNEKSENRKRSILIGSGVAVAAIALLTVSGFLLGHGWFFANLPAEHRVSVFLSALETQDYTKAYGIFYNDPKWQQHPDKYKDYPLQRFTEDFTSASDWKAPIASYHVEYSRRNDTGTAVRATINGSTPLTLFYQRSDGALAFYPLELTRGI